MQLALTRAHTRVTMVHSVIEHENVPGKELEAGCCMRGEGAGEAMPPGWFIRLPGAAASAALAVALAAAVCSTSWAVFFST